MCELEDVDEEEPDMTEFVIGNSSSFIPFRTVGYIWFELYRLAVSMLLNPLPFRPLLLLTEGLSNRKMCQINIIGGN